MLRSLYVLALVVMLKTADSVAQYGPVDPGEASQRVLREAINNEGAEDVLRGLNVWTLPEWQEALPSFLDHPNPQVRVAACVLIAQDETADLPGALLSMETPVDRTLAVRELLITGKLSSDNAHAIQDTVDIEPVLNAMLFSVDRDDEPEAASSTLREITSNTDLALFTRGVAASELAERGEDAPLQSWLKELDGFPSDTRNRVIYELVVLAHKFKSPRTVELLLETTSSRPADDLVRASVTAAALQLVPERGIKAWQEQMQVVETVQLRGAMGMMLLEVDAQVPTDSLQPLKEGPPLHQMLWKLLQMPPESRLGGVTEIIQHGHLPTMSWAIDEAIDQSPSSESTAVMEAILDKTQGNLRPAYLALATKASNIRAKEDPASIATRIGQNDSKIIKEILFASLAIAGTPEAAEAIRVMLEDVQLSNRSMALLVVARAGELDEKQLKLLGRAAAGGGRLPVSFRPSAAWLYLHQTNALNPANLHTNVP